MNGKEKIDYLVEQVRDWDIGTLVSYVQDHMRTVLKKLTKEQLDEEYRNFGLQEEEDFGPEEEED